MKTTKFITMEKKIVSFLLLVLLSSLTIIGQTKSIKGTVVSSADGLPVVGASVLLVGTHTGTATDIDGRFAFNDVPKNVTKIRVSFLGMESVTIHVKPEMHIVLHEEGMQLSDVMVVAYGTAKRASYAGSASVVGNQKIADLPSTSFENALAGQVAGLQVTTSSGQVGSAPEIQIRGIGSMNAGSTPLYVIDGVPVTSGDIGQLSDYTYSTNNALSTLNPEDIESVSVLKDAAASSLYGSRAANGVILITTKSGKQGAPKVQLKASVGFSPSWATKNYEAASTQHQVDMLYTVLHDARTSAGKSEEAASEYALNQLNKKFNKHGYSFSTNGTGAYESVLISEYDNSGRGGRYYDWEDAYFRTGVYQQYDLSVSGATDKTSYYTSLSYNKNQGRTVTNDFQRLSGRVNLSQKIGKYIDFATNVSLSRVSRSGFNDTRNNSTNYFLQTRNLLWGLYWPTDYKTGEDWTSRYGSYAYNNLYYNNEWENESIDTRIAAVETLTLHILPGLDVKEVFSYDNSTVRDHIYYSRDHYYGSSANGKVHEMRTTYEKTVSSTTANYSNSFGSHGIGLLLGFEAEKNATNFTRASGENLPTSVLHTVATAGTTTAGGYSWGNTMVSILSKADYNYAERYFLSASFRRDGSSKLSPEARWGNFWSVSGAWRIQREKFMSNVSWVNELKLRASYGVNGTLPSSNYAWKNLMSYTGKYMDSPAGYITSLSNQNLSWENNRTFNIGIDFAVLQHRLRGTVEYFNRQSTNLLQDVPISQTTGFSSVLQNIGKIGNHGVEIEVGGDIIKNSQLTWSASVNATFLSSKVKSLYGGADIIWYDPTASDSRAQYLYREGESTLAFYGYEWAGVDPSNGKSVYYVNGDNPQDGDFLYNGRGATYDYNNANYTIIGNGIPDVTGGFSTSVKWNGFDLGLNFLYKIGGNLYDGAYGDVADDGYYWERIRSENYYKNMWTPTNTSGTEPRIEGTDLTDAMEYSSRHLHNASFLRLKTLSLAYTLPSKISKKALMSNVRFFFNAENLLTFSKYKDADPEVNNYATRGWETPISKSFVIGVDLSF